MYELPDLFCELYDGLNRQTFRASVDMWETDAALGSLSDAVTHQAGDGTLSRASARARLDLFERNGRDAEAARYATLRGLDVAFAAINPVASTTARTLPPALRRLAADVVIRGRYDSGAHGGALIPRLLAPARSEELADDPREAFSAVLRVPPEDWDAGALSVLAPDALFHRHEVARGLRVGCVPFIADPDEMRWDIEGRGSRRYYRVSPRGLKVTADRISRVLEALRMAEVRIGIVPELMLTPELLDVWQRKVARSGPTTLQWLVVGSGSLDPQRRPTNTAVLINGRSGEELARQQKVFPFTFTPAELARWGLEGRFGRETIEEDLHPGAMLGFLDGGGVRAAILVCEDLARTVDFGRQIRSFGATHLLVPVFARSNKDRRWERTAAEHHCRATGSTVIVANSLLTSTITLGRAATSADAPGTGLVITPLGGDANVLSQPDPAGVATFTLNADRTVDGGDPTP